LCKTKSSYAFLASAITILEFHKQNKKYPETIILCHYAMRVWDRSHYGSMHLYGHSHGHLPDYGKSMDVGVDCHNYYPISVDHVRERLSSAKNFNEVK
jgi:calcineurin-like phosphoesterase family protein